MDFFTGASVMDYELKNALMDLLLTNMKLYISHFYLWIIVMFLSSVWTLILTASFMHIKHIWSIMSLFCHKHLILVVFLTECSDSDRTACAVC